MMNKAKKKVIEVQAIEDIYTMTLERADQENERTEERQKSLQECLLQEEPDEWRIENLKEDIEEHKAKTEAYNKIAEQLLKLM